MWKPLLSLTLVILLFAVYTEEKQALRRLEVSDLNSIKISCDAQVYLNDSWNNSNGSCTINGVTWYCNANGCTSQGSAQEQGVIRVEVTDQGIVVRVIKIIQIIVDFFISLVIPKPSPEIPSPSFGTITFYNSTFVNLTNLYQGQDNVSQSFECVNNTANCSFVIGLLGCTNAFFNLSCDEGSACQFLLISEDSTNVSVYVSTSGESNAQIIILSRNNTNFEEYVDTSDLSNSTNVLGLYDTSSFYGQHNCSDLANCTNNITAYNSSDLDQENWAWANASAVNTLWTLNGINAYQQDLCYSHANCYNDLECWGDACVNVSQRVLCGGEATCENVTLFNETLYAALREDNFSSDACPADLSEEDIGDENEPNCSAYNISWTRIVDATQTLQGIVIIIIGDEEVVELVPILPPVVLEENDTSFLNFSAALNDFYANFSNNSCVSQANCVSEEPILAWINSNLCQLGDGSECSYLDYSYTVGHENCTGNKTLCNETIVSLSDVSALSANFSWTSGHNARNVFVFQNAEDISIVGDCSNGTYCQNLFILNNVSSININITCSDLAICDNIIAANQSNEVSEWVTCQSQTTCGLNVFHQTFTNNSWQWVNCTALSTCGNINTGVWGNDIIQVGECSNSSVASHIAVFENADDLVQNNTCGEGSICQNILTCDQNCTDAVQNNVCPTGAVCVNITNLANVTEPEASEESADASGESQPAPAENPPAPAENQPAPAENPPAPAENPPAPAENPPAPAENPPASEGNPPAQ